MHYVVRKHTLSGPLWWKEEEDGDEDEEEEADAEEDEEEDDAAAGDSLPVTPWSSRKDCAS